MQGTCERNLWIVLDNADRQRSSLPIPPTELCQDDVHLRLTGIRLSTRGRTWRCRKAGTGHNSTLIFLTQLSDEVKPFLVGNSDSLRTRNPGLDQRYGEKRGGGQHEHVDHNRARVGTL